MKNLQYKALSVLLSMSMTAALCGSVPTAVMADTPAEEVTVNEAEEFSGDEYPEEVAEEVVDEMPEEAPEELPEEEPEEVIEEEPEEIIEEEPEEETTEPHVHDGIEYTPLSAEGGDLESGYYYLEEDITLAAPYHIVGEDAVITVCLNGHTITAGDSVKYIFTDTDSSCSLSTDKITFTLDDCSEDNTGKLTGATAAAIYLRHKNTSSLFTMNNGSICGNKIAINSYISMEVNGGSICHNTSPGGYGCGIIIYEAEYLHINKVSIHDNSSNTAAGIYVTAIKDVVINNADISYNSVENMGGAIYVLACKNGVTLNNCTLNHNECTHGSAAAINSDSNDIILNDCSLCYNTAEYHGAAIQLGSANLTLNHTEISNNTSDYDGGAISGGYKTFTITNGSEISNNTSGGNGGAIYCGWATYIIKDSKICNNTGNLGGAIYGGGSITADNAEFSGNTSTMHGGALYFSGAAMTFNNCVFSNNTAHLYGGAIYNMGGSLTVENTKFSGNTAITGGAISAGYAPSTFKNTDFSDNTATDNGGAIYSYSGNMTYANGSISGNKAVKGGGIYHVGSALNLAGTEISGNTASEAGSGVYVESLNDFTVTSGSITDNTGDNLYICNASDTTSSTNRIHTIDPSYTGKIGVTIQDPDVYFYEGSDAADYLAYFTSDDEEYTVVADETGLKLACNYAVNVEETEGGSVVASADRVLPGETVSLTATPDKGYAFDSLKVMQGETEIEVTDNTFVMPDEDVTVIATFVPHVHGDWAYTADGATVTAVCNGEGYCDLDDAQVALTLKAEDAVYTGEATEAVLEGTEAWEAAGLDLPAITYTFKANEDAEAVSADAPINAGYYTASITCGDATASTDFAIAKAVPSYEVPTGLTAAEGDTLADVALPEGFAWADDTESVGTAGVNTFEAVFTPEDTDNYETVTGIELEVTVKSAQEAFTEYKAAAAESLNSLLKDGDNKACSDLIAAAQKRINDLRYNKRNSLEQNEADIDKAVAREEQMLNSQLTFIREHTPTVASEVTVDRSSAVFGAFIANPVSVPKGVYATYSSSDSKVASVGLWTGIITARKAGTTTITCSYYESITRQTIKISYTLVVE